MTVANINEVLSIYTDTVSFTTMLCCKYYRYSLHGEPVTHNNPVQGQSMSP